MNKFWPAVSAFLAGIVLSGAATAETGMFTFDRFPAAAVGKAYGFTPDRAWLDKVRLASVKLPGCSGAFVSSGGLILTNHHCARLCIQQVSTAEQDLMAKGFVAGQPSDERACPEMEIFQLAEITDVTRRIAAATAGKAATDYAATLNAVQAEIKRECAQEAEVRCEIISLYGGGRYDLYKSRRFRDVRLVMAPESSISHFGGDPDNFDFPRYSFDMALLRAYQNGKPVASPDFLPLAKQGLADGELVFMSGQPGTTQREMTYAQMAFHRDYLQSSNIVYLAERRALLDQYSRRGAEPARQAEARLRNVENNLKRARGQFMALTESPVVGDKQAEETAMRARVAADPKLKALAGDAWQKIETAVAAQRAQHAEYSMLEGVSYNAFDSDLFGYARQLVRAADERTKPNATRLREYTDAELPALQRKLESPAPVYPDLQTETLAWSLTKMREALTPDHVAVKAILGKESPVELATRAIRGTRLADPAVRKSLYEGGKAAIDASSDPMIQLARVADPFARATRTRWEQEVDGPIRRYSTQIAQARFQLQGDKAAPDATSSLRLSYGTVKSFAKGGRQVGPFTVVDGLYERATGADPFELPASWLAARNLLPPDTPFNVTMTTDSVGGSSGSPAINKNRELVGLNFDGNLPSLARAFGNPEPARSIGVDVRILRAALQHVYKADRLVRELDGDAVGG